MLRWPRRIPTPAPRQSRAARSPNFPENACRELTIPIALPRLSVLRSGELAFAADLPLWLKAVRDGARKTGNAADAQVADPQKSSEA